MFEMDFRTGREFEVEIWPDSPELVKNFSAYPLADHIGDLEGIRIPLHRRAVRTFTFSHLRTANFPACVEQQNLSEISLTFHTANHDEFRLDSFRLDNPENFQLIQKLINYNRKQLIKN